MTAVWNIFSGSFRSHMRLTLVRPTFQITLVAQPIVMAVLAYMIYQRTGHTNDFFSFVVLGSGMAGMWSSIIFSSAGDINRERFYGTLGPLVGAPASLLLIMLGKIAANGLLSAFSFVISIFFPRLCFIYRYISRIPSPSDSVLFSCWWQRISLH